jgi:hypothetical protein
MKFRRCIHELEDGTLCSQAALKNSPRCRHHQLDARQSRRRHAAKQAGMDRRGNFMMQIFTEILVEPNCNLIDELRATQRFRKVGWIGTDEQLAIQDYFVSGKNALRKILAPTALQYILNNHDKVRQ